MPHLNSTLKTLLIAVNIYLDLPQAYSVLVPTHSSGEHPHLPSICIPNITGRDHFNTLFH